MTGAYPINCFGRAGIQPCRAEPYKPWVTGHCVAFISVYLCSSVVSFFEFARTNG
jgi:hypothetical protein